VGRRGTKPLAAGVKRDHQQPRAEGSAGPPDEAGSNRCETWRSVAQAAERRTASSPDLSSANAGRRWRIIGIRGLRVRIPPDIPSRNTGTVAQGQSACPRRILVRPDGRADGEGLSNSTREVAGSSPASPNEGVRTGAGGPLAVGYRSNHPPWGCSGKHSDPGTDADPSSVRASAQQQRRTAVQAGRGGVSPPRTLPPRGAEGRGLPGDCGFDSRPLPGLSCTGMTVAETSAPNPTLSLERRRVNER
jgi:hypothetical protein